MRPEAFGRYCLKQAQLLSYTGVSSPTMIPGRGTTQLQVMPVDIPIAIHDERLSTLRRTLLEVARQEGVGQDEIFLYCNLPNTLGDREKAAAHTKLDDLVYEFSSSYPNLTLRSVIEEYDPNADPSDPAALQMGRIRHDYMNMIAWMLGCVDSALIIRSLCLTPIRGK